MKRDYRGEKFRHSHNSSGNVKVRGSRAVIASEPLCINNKKKQGVIQ